jgi:glycosyltransferase involved in cell wall biosynthesis
MGYVAGRCLGRHWVFFAVDAKLSSLRKALALRLAESAPVVVIERAVSAIRQPRRWPMHARVHGLEYRPFHWPERMPILGRLGRELNVRRLRRELDRLCPPGPRYVCYDSPSQAALAGRLNEACTIYLAIDDRTKTVAGLPIPGEEATERELLGQVDLVVCVSEHLAQVLRSRMPAKDPARLVVVENGFDERLFDASQEHVEPEGLRDVPRPRGLVAGHVSERIDWEGVAACRRRLPAVHWVFVGPADAGMIDRVGRVGAHFRPPVPLAEIPAWIAHCDFGAVPYRLNAFTQASCPLKALEIMAMGAPVLATPVPSLLQFPGAVSFVRPGDGSSYASAVESLIVAGGKPRPPNTAIREAYSYAGRLRLFLRAVEGLRATEGPDAVPAAPEASLERGII